MSIELGDKVKDTITGYEGVATARSEYLNGCIRFQLEQWDEKKSELHEFWFDEERLIVTKSQPRAVPLQRTGGARPNPSRTSAH